MQIDMTDRHHHQHLYNMSLEKVAVVEQADKFVRMPLCRLFSCLLAGVLARFGCACVFDE